nr:hypothetical protein [Acholeplasmatales bacterium]
MIIKDIKKIKNKNEYLVTIETDTYKFNEDTILEYRLFKDKEISKDILDKAISKNNLNDYYNMALKYSYKYAKSAYEIRIYLV